MRRRPCRLRIRLTLLSPVILASFLLLPAPAMLSAQPAEERPRFWIGIGLGAGRDHDATVRSAGMGQAVYQTGPHHLAVRLVGLQGYYRSTPTSSEVSLIYGRTALTPSGHATVGTGISTVRSCSSDFHDFTERCVRGIGLPVVAEAALRWWVVGVGVQAFANVNQQRSYVGGALFFQVGSLGS